jgi:multidrug efflux pump subunit AcrA (membrane-fusion protein)
MLESRQQQLTVELANLNYEASQEEATNDLAVLAAEEGLLEAERKLKTLELSLQVAKNISENKSAVEIAKTDEATSKTQLERAKTARSQFDKSVSESEMIRLTADFRKAELGVAEAESKHLTSELQVHVHTAELDEQQATISRNKHLVEQERRKLKQAARTSETRRVELELAKAMLDRRKVLSPLTGVVVRHSRQPGEFVEAGTPILRVIQLDRLRAEGFVDVAIASPALKSRAVRIEVTGIGARKKTLSGVITFVGQEVDPLNQQVRVWAEFESPELDVYPGMTAEMTILSAGRQTLTSQPATELPDTAEPANANAPSVDQSASLDGPEER